MKRNIDQNKLDTPIDHIEKSVGDNNFSFVLFKEDKHFLLITHYLYIKQKDNYTTKEFNSEQEAYSFINNWFDKKKAKMKREMVQILRVSDKHQHCSFFNDKKYLRIDGKSKSKGSCSDVRIMHKEKDFLLSSIKRKITFDDILELDDINDMVDFVRMHFG